MRHQHPVGTPDRRAVLPPQVPREPTSANGPSTHLPVFFAPALGPHPQRELTPTLRRGVARARRSVAAGAPVPPVLIHLHVVPRPVTRMKICSRLDPAAAISR